MKKQIVIILTIILAISCAAFAAADGQNPAMNIIGDYQDSFSQRAMMHIDPLGAEDAEVTIHWANSAFEAVEWHFSGACAGDSGMTIEYSNCVKKIVTANEDGETTEEIEYENGTGRLVFDAENGSAVWADDQENAGEDCVFEFAPMNNTTSLNGIEMGESEASVREKMGVPAKETETAGLKDLMYSGVPFAGREMEVHFLIGDDVVRAFRVMTREGNGDVANDISMFMEELSNGAAPGLDEEKIKSIGAKYCGLTDFAQLGYFDRYAQDGCAMIYIRTSEKDIDMLILDHFLQFAEE